MSNYENDNQSYTATGAASQSKRIQSRISDVGGIPVARALPTKEQRMIGPWCFLDHAGPVQFSEDSAGMQVGPHPHTCLQTFTWMLAGTMLHRDSVGSEQIIKPGQVNLMTAGHGICHTESSQFSEGDARELHAAQLWIALPEDKADIAPRFDHYPNLPTFTHKSVSGTVLIGTYADHEAPTLCFSPIVGVDFQFLEDGSLTLTLESSFEYGVLALEGGFELGDEHYDQDELCVLCCGHKSLTLNAKKGTRILLIGGEPFAENVTIWWNYVGHSKEYISKAQQDWHAEAERFGEIENPNAPRMPGPEVPWR